MYDAQVQHTKSASTTGRETGYGVVAEQLGKRYGDDLWALRELDLHVLEGSVLGLLGHNGAGKSTTIRILTTLTQPTTGRAWVAGHDVVADGPSARRRIGVAAQQATVDGLLTGRVNLELVARLHGVGRAQARQRADELLELLDLTDAGDRLVKQFSGGMRRRLDVAASLVAHPQVLFLDEPTTGLDPRSRGDLWQLLRRLVDDGTTLILTTQYLEEADRLADEIVVLDHGRPVATGSPTQLKSRIGSDRFEIKVGDAVELVAAAAAVSAYADADPTFDDEQLTVTISVGPHVKAIDIVRALDDSGIDAVDVTRRQATLDDVFLALTEPHTEAVQ